MKIGSVATNVGNKLSKGVGGAIDKVANTKFVSKYATMAKEDNARFLGKMALFSFLSKDAINCVLYTGMSWNNKKLENPHFMALIDLVQGILNVSLQGLVGTALLEKKLIPALQNKYNKTLFSDENILKNAKNVVDNMNTKLGMKMSADQAGKMVEKATGFAKSNCKAPFSKGISVIVTVLGTTALVKRTIVPFIATPIASAMDNKMKEKEAAKKAQAQTQTLEEVA